MPGPTVSTDHANPGADAGVSADVKTPPVASSTEDAYRRVAMRLAKTFLASGGTSGPLPLGVDADAFVEWIPTLKAERAQSTWRQFKAAVVFVLLESGQEEAASRLKAVSSSGALKRGRKTSATKRKGFPSRDRARLIGWISDRRAAYSELLVAWIVAGIRVGLRPREWHGSRFLAEHPETGRPALVVRNAKATQGRANGAFRTLFLDDVPADDVHTIKSLSEFCAAQTAEQFERVYTNCRHLIAAASRALWPRRDRHYTLYSCRHQFAANAKKIRSRTEVGALMGHADDATAAHHYARAVQGEGGALGLVPTARPAEVATVKHVPTRAEIAAANPPKPPLEPAASPQKG